MFTGDRYEVHTDLGHPPLAEVLGTANEVGCEPDTTVLGTVEVRSVRGVSPAAAIAVATEADGQPSVYVYLNAELPRDRAPIGWPVSLPPDAFQ